MRIRTARPRTGFTLLELLVVMGIIIVIATLAVLFLPNLDRHKGVPNATTQLHGWVNLSKQHALRDHKPKGIRLMVDPSNPSRCTSLQYIEQPEPFAPRGNGVKVVYSTWQSTPTSPIYTTASLYSFLSDPPTALPWEGVAVNDYLELTNVPDVVARITAIDDGGTGVANSRLLLDRDVTTIDGQIRADGFRVLRSPRPLMGEPALQMHKDVYIDLVNSYPMGVSLPTTDPVSGDQYYDILFNSTGFVGNATTGQIFLLIQHVDRTNDHLLLAIYTRTGRIAPYNVNDSGVGTIYDFARTGESPGL